jgi:hypothetical protein
VIWTSDSVHSDYVVSEAERARVAGKLIQLRTADVEPTDLPPPFDTSHMSLVEDRKAIYGRRTSRSGRVLRRRLPGRPATAHGDRHGDDGLHDHAVAESEHHPRAA